MYELLLRGVHKPVFLTPEQKSKVETTWKDEKIPNDTVLTIGDSSFKKGEIKTIVKSEATFTSSEKNTGFDIHKLRNDAKQIYEVLYLRSRPLEHRTQLSHIKIIVEATGYKITDEQWSQVRDNERLYFLSNPEHIIWFDAKVLATIFGESMGGGRVSKASMSGSMGKLSTELAIGFVRDYRYWQGFSTVELNKMFQEKKRALQNLSYNMGQFEGELKSLISRYNTV